MSQLIEYIDKIAREKNRDVLFIRFAGEIYPDYDYQDYSERT